MILARRRFTVTIDEIARDGESLGARMAKQLRIYADMMDEQIARADRQQSLLIGITVSDTMQTPWTDPITGATVTWTHDVYVPAEREDEIQQDFAG